MDSIDKAVVSDNLRMGWASDVVAEMLRRLGIKYISLNPGASYRGFHDSIVNYLGNRDPQMVLCLHEDHAVSVAHGYAQVTGEPMACALHSNVGLLHGTMGIFNAWCDRVPMFVMGANGPVDADKRRPWIDWIHTTKDTGAVLRNYIKWDDEPRSAQASVEAMLRANQITRTAPKAPVYICLDAGLQEEELTEPVTIPDVERFATASSPQPSEADLEEAAKLLAGAKKPVIMTGRTSRRQEDWNRRVKLAEALGAYVLSDGKSGASFPTDHPLAFAPPATFPPQATKDLICEADVILSLDWNDLAGIFRSASGGAAISAKVIQCSVDAYVHNGWSADHQGLPVADLWFLAEPDVVVEGLLPRVEAAMKGKKAKWAGRETTETPSVAATAGDVPTSRHIMAALEQVRGKRKLTMTSLGMGGGAGEVYHFRDPLDYLGGSGGAGLGGGPGMAVGAGLALKGTGRLPVCVDGDGDFLQGVTALWTAAHYEIPVLYIIYNNRSNFNDEVHQETVAKIRNRPPENKWIGMRLENPETDLAAMARAQGVQASGPIKNAADLPAEFEKGLKVLESGKPYLIDVWVAQGSAVVHDARTSAQVLVSADD